MEPIQHHITPSTEEQGDREGNRGNEKRVKIFPQVNNNEFKVELVFDGAPPAGIRRGQTLQISLELGASSSALLVPNGAFYQDTGRDWVFVPPDDGSRAVRRNVQLGRRNTAFIEALDVERVQVGKAFGIELTPILSWYAKAYGVVANTLSEAVRNKDQNSAEAEALATSAAPGPGPQGFPGGQRHEAHQGPGRQSGPAGHGSAGADRCIEKTP